MKPTNVRRLEGSSRQYYFLRCLQRERRIYQEVNNRSSWIMLNASYHQRFEQTEPYEKRVSHPRYRQAKPSSHVCSPKCQG